MPTGIVDKIVARSRDVSGLVYRTRASLSCRFYESFISLELHDELGQDQCSGFKAVVSGSMVEVVETVPLS